MRRTSWMGLLLIGCSASVSSTADLPRLKAVGPFGPSEPPGASARIDRTPWMPPLPPTEAIDATRPAPRVLGDLAGGGFAMPPRPPVPEPLATAIPPVEIIISRGPDVDAVEPPPDADVPCDPDVIEPLAEIGALSRGQRGCMEQAVVVAPNPATRHRLSLALIANAVALGDPSWIGLVERHLSQIDPTDASLALRLAHHELTFGDAVQALKWSEIALDHRAAWSPGVYEDRTWSALQVRASAAQTRWRRLQALDATPETIEAARLHTVKAASDWRSYARLVERNGTVAARLCQVAGC